MNNIKNILKTLKNIKEKQDPDIKDKKGTQPARYFSGLAPSTKDKRDAHFKKTAKLDPDDPKAYELAPGDARAKTKPSKHTKKYQQMFGEQKIEGLVKKAKETGVDYNILKQVYDRGMAAWRTGRRPGTTPHQWAFARVNSFLTGGKTQQSTDKDLFDQLSSSQQSKITEQLESNDYIRMALKQLRFIELGANEIKNYIETNQEIPAWFSNKLAKTHSEMESLYSYIKGKN
jgi:hypothetical protein